MRFQNGYASKVTKFQSLIFILITENHATRKKCKPNHITDNKSAQQIQHKSIKN